jgi:colanic acid biosynthesis glycosyl transferase WcaI
MIALRILVHDFAGHPFPAELSRSLAAAGHDVCHMYCGGVTTGQGALSLGSTDPPQLSFLDLAPGRFERYSAGRRVASEARYGIAGARAIRRMRPDVVISSNTPLLSLALMWSAARTVQATRVYWLQDFLGAGTRRILDGRSRLLGATAGAAFERIEDALLRRSDAVIAISEDFLAELDERGVRAPVQLIENWAPLDEIRPEPKANAWSERHGFAERPVVTYSGTLGLKHDPEHLVALARGLAGTDAAVVVISEGRGRSYLEGRKAAEGLQSLYLFDFLPYEELPLVLGASDVCVALLEPDAGKFSVPSKILSYLAAGRPIVAAVPHENLAARVIQRSQAGAVVEPGDHRAFVEATRSLLLDGGAADAGHRARRYAESTFDVERITSEVLQLIERARNGTSNPSIS